MMEAPGPLLSEIEPSLAPSDPRDRTFVMVTDLARELGITARALRFYEDKGLIQPHRVAATRIYTARDRARMILVLRGKRLGFSLREIKDYLDLYDADPRQVTQTRALLERIAERRAELVDKQNAIADALAGLDDLERDASAILAKAPVATRKAAPRSGRLDAVPATAGKEAT